jgi:hypothetical protein
MPRRYRCSDERRGSIELGRDPYDSMHHLGRRGGAKDPVPTPDSTHAICVGLTKQPQTAQLRRVDHGRHPPKRRRLGCNARSDLDRRRRGRRHPMRPPSLARATTARLVARVMITGAGSTPPLGAAGPFADTGPSPTSISNDEDWTMNVGTALTKVFIARHSTQSRAGMRYESGLPTAWPSPVLCVAFAL